MRKFYLFALALLTTGLVSYSQNSPEAVVQNYFNILKGESNFKTADLDQWQITDVVPSLNPNVQHVYVQQLHNNIPIQYATYKFTVNSGKITYKIDQFVTDIQSKTAATSASISAEDAVMKTVQAHNLKSPSLNGAKNAKGIYVFEDTTAAGAPIKVQAMYQMYEGQLRLVWNVSYYQTDGQHWWSENIDAANGQILRTEDWVVSCNWGDDHETHGHENANTILEDVTVIEGPANMLAGESYNVYAMPKESPLDGGRTVVNDPQDLNASPFGWHDTNGANGAEFTITRGNNCWAMEDANGNNGTGYSPSGGNGLDFNFPVNFNNQPGTYRDAAITNLFYWSNIMHDVYYQYGFDEASGNFQENNYGNGGAGSDSVIADAQDGSGTNNANFGTPPDGSNPRMQMFLWTTTNPQTDGDFDNGIIAHEYGHGISTRLVGGPGTNALGGSEQMGEGWSDFFALMLTMKSGDSGSDARGIGNFALGENNNGGGIRPTPYSTSTSVNGTTYGDINSLAVPHGVGYAWATILWDMNWALIAQEGFDTDFYNGDGGNNIAMSLVIEGLKNTANNPGFVSGRDGILQADQDLYGGQYNCLIWDVFAARGVGLGANENANGGTNTNTDQTVSFTSGCSGPPTPESCSGTVSNFPDTESFESNLGDWSQSTQDDVDWTRDSAGTPSSGTGPSTGANGNFYVFVEASGNGAGYPNKRAILNSPCYDLSAADEASFNFSYHMFGAADMGSIDLEVSTNDGANWTSIWNETGNKGDQWNTESVNLNSYAGESSFRMRFNRVTGSTWQADIALDAFEMEAGLAPDTQAPTVPVNLAVSNIADTSLTLNWNASNDNVGVTGYQIFMNGTSLGTVTATTANVTGLEAGTTYSYQVRAFDAAGNNSGLSNTVNATTTGGASSGCQNGVSDGYSESFESSIGAWTQSNADDINWTRDASGTPSNGTGPSSGSPGSFYMFVEASGNGTGYPNKRAILDSPCIDLSGEAAATFSFNYHMFGASDMGSIALEASTDGTSWTSIWSATGNKGNQWNSEDVSLDAYAGGTVQLRFNRVTGSTWQADIAIDNVTLTSGGGSSGCAMVDLDTNYNSFATQDNGNSELLSGNTVLKLSNNAWKFIDFDYTITSNTVIQFDFRSDTQGEIHGIALESDNTLSSNISFKVHGTQNWGIQDFDNYPNNGQWVSYTIDVGNFYTGGADRLLFIADHDAGPSNGDSFYRNVTIFEDANRNGVCDGQEGTAQSNFGGTDTAAPINGNTAEDPIDFFDFEIYPNPVLSQLHIRLAGVTGTSYEVLSVTGQVVMKGVFTETLDVNSLASGMYILQVQAGETSFIERFIKE